MSEKVLDYSPNLQSPTQTIAPHAQPAAHARAWGAAGATVVGRRSAQAALALTMAAYLAGFAFAVRGYYMDDAYIGFQFVRNVVAGHGFVFFPGMPPVEGVTNIGWLALLVPLSVFMSPPVAAKLLGLVFVVACAALTFLISRTALEAEQGKSRLGLLAFGPVLLVLTSFDFLYFSLAGMETALLAAILLFMVYKATQQPGSVLLPLAGVAAFLVHPEGGLVFLLFAFFSHRNAGINRSKIALHVGLFLVLVLAFTLFRDLYFGALIPNTFASKPANIQSLLNNLYLTLIGKNVNLVFPVTTVFAVPFLLIGYRRLARSLPNTARMLGATTLTGLAFAVYALPDWTNMGRYFAPYLPAAAVLLWLGVVDLISRYMPAAQPNGRSSVAVVIMMGLVCVGMADTAFKLDGQSVSQYPGYVLVSKSLVEPALWVRDHLPSDAVIATRRIGVLAYYSDRRIFDYKYGLTEPDVTALIGVTKQQFDDPNSPALVELWQKVHPTWLLEDDRVIDFIVKSSGGTRSGFAVHGVRYRVVKAFPIGAGVSWTLASEEPSR